MDTEIQLDLDIITLTTKTVEFLLSKNPDSLILYIFYIKNAKIQKTNKIWIQDKFCATGLKWGKQRVSSAKALLIDENFIEISSTRTDGGRLDKTFIKINYIFKSLNGGPQPQNPPVVPTTCGFGDTNALSNKKEMLKVIKDKESDVPSEPETDKRTCLPESFGKSPNQRLGKLYQDLWMVKFGSAMKTFTYPRFGKAIKQMLEVFTEIQIAAIMDTYFDWMGVNGNNQSDNDFLAGNGFTVELMSKRADIYLTYIKNVLGVKMDDIEACRGYCSKVLKLKKII